MTDSTPGAALRRTVLVRWALFGALIGAFIAVVPACNKPCGPGSCDGCCNAKNECVSGSVDLACGKAGAACTTCSDTQTCTTGACVSKSGGTGGGGGTGGSGGGASTGGGTGTGGGTVDAGPPPCKNDLDCRVAGSGLICDSAAGKCIPGTGCTQSSECQNPDPNNKCYEFGQQCFCDPHDGAMGKPGTCRLRRAPCDECASDLECGSEQLIFDSPGLGQGKCVTLTSDANAKKYCLYKKDVQCSCGLIDDGMGFCKPQSNSCTQVGCNADKDCATGSVCSLNNPDAGAGSCGGLCVPRCRWDFRTGSEVSPGCAPGTVCWVDSANLDPNSQYYGAGHCKPACQSDTDCKQSAANPFGGNNLKCAAETVPGGGMSLKRCRANGPCMDNAECPNTPIDVPSLGYCDRGNFTCKTDCRNGNDPVTGQPFGDCRSPFTCGHDAGVNFCRQQTCMEQGGASVACSTGQYCCGEDANRDGTPDPCPPKAEQDVAGCFKAPTPPFCTTCATDSDCASPANPAWMSCANGAKNQACSPLPARCLYAGARSDGSMGVSICAPATWNDTTVFNVTKTRARLGCPVNYPLQWVRPVLNPTQTDYCQSNDDCNVGTDAGACEPDPDLRLMDGGLGKSCRCTVGSGKSQCPQRTDGGAPAECRAGVAGQRTACIESVVCMPGNGKAYEPVTNFGCGL